MFVNNTVASSSHLHPSWSPASTCSVLPGCFSPLPPAQGSAQVIVPALRVHKLRMYACVHTGRLCVGWNVGRVCYVGDIGRQAPWGLGQEKSVLTPNHRRDGMREGHLAPRLGGCIREGLTDPWYGPTLGPSVLTPEAQDPQTL